MNPTLVTVRRAGQDDDSFVRDLAALSHAQVDPSRERQLPQATLLIAERKDLARPLAVAFALGWTVAEELELLDLVVKPEERRHGIAERLVRELFEIARQKGAEVAFLEVRASNEPAQRLYRKLGFSEVGRRSGYYAGGEDALLFRCCVSPAE
jgi:ribosomal-protein-alanine acetyltransferase